MSKLMKPNRLTVEEAMAQVFSNDMLVDFILERAIRSNQGFGESENGGTLFSKQDVMSFRLVSKTWFRAVMKIYRTSRNPIFHLPLTHMNTSGLLAIPNEQCEEEQQAPILSQFLSCMAYWDLREPGPNFPPFHLLFCPSFFQVANAPVYDSVFDFMSKYGASSMTKFTFNFHRNRFDYIPTPATVPKLCFPKLKHIVLVIERMAWSFIPLIQKLLQSAPNLETLDFTSSSCIVTYSVAHLSDVIESIARSRPYALRLPDNTRKILLYGTVDSCSCFYKLPVDNLKKLETLSVSASACMIKQIDEMFGPLSGHLLNLHFVGFTSCVYLFNRHYNVTFPPMLALKSLTIAMPWEMREGVTFSYSTHLPVLKELTIIHHDTQVFSILLCSTGSVTVEKCTVICIQPHVYAENGYRSSSQRMDATRRPVVEAIRDAFPNLTHLGIGVNAMNSEGLAYVFTHMTHIKSLAIYVETNARFKTTLHWDSLFTGLSTVACKSLIESRDVEGYWESVHLIDERYPSIRSLVDLEELYIIEITYPNCRAFSSRENGNGGSGHGACNFEIDTLPQNHGHLFSDVSFHFSFFGMKNLKKLAFSRGFMPSKTIQEKWFSEKGKRIKTLKSPKLYHLLTAKFFLDDDEWYHED